MTILLCFLFLGFVIFGLLMVFLRPAKAEGVMETRLRSVLAVALPKESGAQAAQELEAPLPGNFDWVEQLIEGTALLRSGKLLLLQSQSEWTVGGVLFSSALMGTLAVVITYAVTSNALLALPAVLLGGIPYWVLRHKRSRRLTAFDKALPGAIEMCARSLRAGHSIVAAIGTLAEEAVEPARTEFGEVFRKQSYGLTQRDALLEMLQRVPSRDLRVFITGILVQKDTGGNLPEIMDRIVAVIRDRVRIQGEVRTHTAQGRLTGWILCLLPLALMLLINLMNPGYSRILLDDPVGQKLLYAGVGLLATGAFMIRSIVRGIEV